MSDFGKRKRKKKLVTTDNLSDKSQLSSGVYDGSWTIDMVDGKTKGGLPNDKRLVTKRNN